MTPEKRKRFGTPRRLTFIGGATAGLFLFATTLATQLASATDRQDLSPAQVLLNAPPQIDYANVCTPPATETPLTRDWTQWDGHIQRSEIPSAIADAGRYKRGGEDVPQDKQLARKLLEAILALDGVFAAEAKMLLGDLLVDPEAGAIHPQRAKTLLSDALAAQEFRAALPLSRLLTSPQFGEFDPDAAARVLATAAGLGDARAALLLAELYADGQVSEPFEGAAQHFRKLAMISAQTAIVAGDCDILRTVGDFLIKIAQTEQDMKNAALWFEAGRAAGDPDAIKRLADLYAKGKGKPADMAQARSLWLEAAQLGNVSAATAAAEAMLQSGVEFEAAVSLLRDAVSQGSMKGYELLARQLRGDFGTAPDFLQMNAVLAEAMNKPSASAAVLTVAAEAAMKGQGVEPDIDRARELYKAAAATERPDGVLEYGRFLLADGKDRDTGIALIRDAAEAGNAGAMHDLSELILCRSDLGTPSDALAWDERAAASGSSGALRRFARDAAESNGLGEVAPSTQQLRFLERAAEAGDRRAMVEFALALMERPGEAAQQEAARWMTRAEAAGEGSTRGKLTVARAMLRGAFPGGQDRAAEILRSLRPMQDPEADVEIARLTLSAPTPSDGELRDAATLLTRAAKAGRSDAMLMLAKLGNSESVGNVASPKQWLVMAAERGDPEALSFLRDDDPAIGDVLDSLERRLVCNPETLVQAARLYRSRGGTTDLAKAKDNLEQARVLASARASDLYDLAEAYLSGLATGVEAPEEALPLLEMAAQRGHLRAAVALGETLAKNGEEARFADALDWLGRAAVTGEPKAVQVLAGLARERSGSSEALDEVLQTLKSAGKNGVTSALTAYGTILVTVDEGRRRQGVEAITEAADAGDVDAMKALARFYASGLGGDVSADESTRWIRAAAEKGDPEAMYRYALALDLGFGVEADHDTAATWHDKAREHGYGQ